MAEKTPTEQVHERAAAAIAAADSGSNHQAGVDGDEQSAADQAAGQGPPGDHQGR